MQYKQNTMQINTTESAQIRDEFTTDRKQRNK